MKALLLPALCCLLFSCASTEKPQDPGYLKSPHPIDRKIESATIEDYILAVPAYTFHEGDRAGFEKTVRNARALPQNQGRPADELYVPGDGSAGPYEFVLDRGSHALNARYVGRNAETPPHTIRYQRIPGGWQTRNL